MPRTFRGPLWGLNQRMAHQAVTTLTEKDLRESCGGTPGPNTAPHFVRLVKIWCGCWSHLEDPRESKTCKLDLGLTAMVSVIQSWLEEKQTLDMALQIIPAHGQWSFPHPVPLLLPHLPIKYQSRPPWARHCAQYWVFNTEQNSSSFPRPKKNILEANFCSYHNFPFPHHACPGNAGLRKGKNLEAESSHQAYNRDDTLPLLRWACAPRHIASLASDTTQVPAAIDLASGISNHEFPLPYPKSTHFHVPWDL